MRAAASGEAHSVARLLEDGSDPNAADSRGTTALSLAAQFGRADVTALLLRAGAEVDLADTDGVTPLMKAARFGHEEALEQASTQRKRDAIWQTRKLRAAARAECHENSSHERQTDCRRSPPALRRQPLRENPPANIQPSTSKAAARRGKRPSR
jgi:hypothetical protein